LQAVGEQLLSEPRYAEVAVKLAILDDLAMSEVGPVFERVCRESAHPLPSLDDAIDRVSEAILGDIADGSVESQRGLQRLMDDIYWPHLAASSAEEGGGYVGESHGLHHLIGAYWSYNELRSRASELSIDGKRGEDALRLLEKVIGYARAWLCEHTV
jgi:hypothetical protein